jgi:peptidyl-tRNA hydrolase
MIIANITVTNGHSHVDLTSPRNSKHTTELYGEKKALLNMRHPSMLTALPRKQLYGNNEGTTINTNVNTKNRETDTETNICLGVGPNLHLVFMP